MKDGRGLPASVQLMLVLIFCLSGASALAYQVLWTRQLTFVLGGSAFAVSTILAVFFGGLGLGSFLGGRIADRLKNPLLGYSLAEIGIAVFALATPALLSASGTVYLGLYKVFAGNPTWVLISRVLATAVILLVPTTLMGATLPLVVRFYVRRIDRVGRGLGLLYGINTFGGVLGCGYVGYYSILTYGVHASFYIAVAANLAAAVGALAVALFARSAPVEESQSGATEPNVTESGATESSVVDASGARNREFAGGERLLWLVTLGFFISGFTSIAYEVLWTRALNFAIGNSVYAFTTIVVVFLAGLVPGAFVAGWLADRTRSPIRTLGWIQLLTCGAILIPFSQAGKLPQLTNLLVEKLGAGTLFADVATKVLPAAVALFVPAVIIGLTFPFILKVAIPRLEGLGRRVGSFYAVNTVGGILGSTVAGFVLLPTIGMVRGMLLIVFVNALMGMIYFFKAEARTGRNMAVAFGAATALSLLVAIFRVEPVPFIEHTRIGRTEGIEVIFQEEGHTSTVAVTEKTGPDGAFEDLTLHINLLGASVVDKESFHQQYYALSSLIPAALHSAPKNVFVAGLASGVTAGAAGIDERTERVTCVEISPEVISAAALFDDRNYHATTSPKITVLCDDARAYLATTDERYDVIVTDVFISAVTGTSSLYSYDYFELCRTRLAPGGIMSVGVGNLVATDRTVARSFVESFEYVATLMMPDPKVYNRVFLIGSNEPLQFSRSSVEAAYAQPQFAREMAVYKLPDPEDLTQSYLASQPELHDFLSNGKFPAEICTDDRPIIDFLSVAWAEGFVGTSGRSRGAGVGILARKLKGTRELPGLAP